MTLKRTSSAMAFAVALLKTGDAAIMALPGDIGGERLFSRELPKSRSCADSELVLLRISPPTLELCRRFYSSGQIIFSCLLRVKSA